MSHTEFLRRKGTQFYWECWGEKEKVLKLYGRINPKAYKYKFDLTEEEAKDILMNWISVKDRFPKDGQDCWVCRHDETVSRAEYICSHEIFGSGFGNYDEFIKDKYVKCWMPYFSPDPPGE